MDNARGIVATATTQIAAPPEKVWAALTDPEQVAGWMFGTTLESTWTPGEPITWSGEWEGKAYQDKGVVTVVEEPRHLAYTHYSPLSGAPDEPASYHGVDITLTPEGHGTGVTLEQDNNDTEDAQEHSARNWATMLDGLKQYLEAPTSR